jgi:hypothetical protein
MATNLFSPAAVKSFDMAHESRHQFCPHDFAEEAQILRNSREGFRGRWLVSGNCAREGPAQSSEPEKHRSKFIARRTTTKSLTGDAWDA